MRKIFAFYVNPQVKAKIARAAKKQNMSMARLIESVMEKYCDEKLKSK